LLHLAIRSIYVVASSYTIVEPSHFSIIGLRHDQGKAISSIHQSAEIKQWADSKASTSV